MTTPKKPARPVPPPPKKPPVKETDMLLDPPASLAPELQNRWNAHQNALLVQPPNQTMVNLTRNLLNKTIDKCSVELGQPVTPRPVVMPQEDETLKLQYEAA
jgi:hypothetical protein